jgi:predicted transcriptional regulator YdeE
VEPEIISKDRFKIIGVKKRIKSESPHFHNVWKEFTKNYDKIKASSIDNGFYGINFEPDEDNFQDYIAGIAVDNDYQNSDRTFTEHIQPSSLYAVFECKLNNIGPTYMKIFSEWVKNNQYSLRNFSCFEYYPPNTVKPDDKVFLYIPINKNS